MLLSNTPSSSTARAPAAAGAPRVRGTTTTTNRNPPAPSLVSRPPSLVARRSFTTTTTNRNPLAPRLVMARATGGGETEGKPDDDEPTTTAASAAFTPAKGGGAGESGGLKFKAAFFAAEALGNLVGGGGGGSSSSSSSSSSGGDKTSAASSASAAPMSRDAILASIREDFEANYFLTGQGDMAAYADDCLYADPFSSFRGTQRFKNNVGNFGKVVDAISVDLGDLGLDLGRDPAGNTLAATWRFSGVVKVLPWRPVLAASGATRHVIDPIKGKVVEHIEEWRSPPGEVLARLLEPSNRGPPVNRWEAALGARKRAGGSWGAALRAAVEWKEGEEGGAAP